MRTTVVVGYDRTLPSGRALLEAGREAAYRDADVTVVHVRRPDTAARGTGAAEREASAPIASFGAGVLRHRYPGLTAPEPRAGARTALDQILAERQERCVRVRADGEVVAGSPPSVLTAAAARADLVVAGARRRHSGHCAERYRVRIGPVAQALPRGAACPVIIVPHS